MFVNRPRLALFSVLSTRWPLVGDDRAADATYLARDSFALGGEAKPRSALTTGGDAVERHKAGQERARHPIAIVIARQRTPHLSAARW